MKTQQSLYFAFYMVLLGLLIITGCIFPASTPLPIPVTLTATSPFVTVAADAPTPNLTSFIAPTLITIPTVPVLNPNQEQRMADVLQSSDCILPCYLGITPGKTTLKEGIAILENLGGRRLEPLGGVSPYQRETDSAFSYTYQFHIGDPSTGEKIVYGSITLITDSKLVQVVEIASSTSRLEAVGQKALEIYKQYWQRYYTAKQIFLQLGEPEQIYTFHDRSDTLILSYNDPPMIFEIVGLTQENNLCPRDRSVFSLSIHMTISSANSPFNINGDGRVPLTDREVYLPIEETFGITSREYYESVLEDPSVCFEPKIANP